jgi:predicted ATP-grasp superfamily ATP-dependent carboligase
MTRLRSSARRDREEAALDTDVPVLVLRTDRNVFHHGTLGVIRSFGRAGVEVHAVLEGRGAPATWSRHLRQGHSWLPGVERDEELVDALERVADRIDRRALLVTVDDAGAIFVAEQAERLRRSFLFPRQEADLPRRVSDKASLAAICGQLGVAHPQTHCPTSEAEVREAIADLGLPVVAKWARPWLLTPGVGLRSTTVLHSLADAIALFARVPQARGPLLLQRHLPPRPDGDWFFHGYFDGISRCVLGATGRKERAYPPTAGLTSLGRWVENEQLFRLAERLGGAIGYRGILDLDFRYEPATGAYHLLDFNPRLGAQFRLFTDRSGLDLVRALHLDLTGRVTPPIQPNFGRALMVENYDVLSALSRRAGAGTRLARARSLRGVGEFAWFAPDDPAPFVAMGAVWAAHGADRFGRRIGARLGRRPRPDAGATSVFRPADAADATNPSPDPGLTDGQPRTETRT